MKPPYPPRVWNFSPTLWTIASFSALPREIAESIETTDLILSEITDASERSRSNGSDPVFEFLKQVHWWNELRGLSPSRQLLGMWLRSVFPLYNLAAEKLDMAHAVEVRLPFLDHHLWRLLGGLPTDNFMDGKKTLLKELVGDLLPPSIHHAAKGPFLAPPMNISDPLFTFCADLICSGHLKGIPGLSNCAVKGWIDTCRKGKSLHLESQTMLQSIASLMVTQKSWKIA